MEINSPCCILMFARSKCLLNGEAVILNDKRKNKVNQTRKIEMSKIMWHIVVAEDNMC